MEARRVTARNKSACFSFLVEKQQWGFPVHPLPHGLSLSVLHGRVPAPLGPFFAPLPCWWTLTVVLSNIRVVSSTMSWAISSSKMYSQTPCWLHRRNRVYTLFHGPYRSGRSRHRIPVFIQYKIPFTIIRLSFPGFPACFGFSDGNRSFTFFHGLSVISCRFIFLLYHCFPLLSTICLKRGSMVFKSEHTN